MSAFEDFIQTELPKRGYLNTDVSQESIIVRRGAGPRQFDAVQLAEGQVLAYVNGALTGQNVSSFGVRKAIYEVLVANAIWTITHNLNSENVIIQAFDEDKYVIIPESIQIVDADTVELRFNTALTGTARIIFLD